VTDTIIASPRRHLELGGASEEASLAVIRRDGNGGVLWWAAADVFSLTLDGSVVMPQQGQSCPLLETD
jgi:hypothetical protein